MSKSNGITSIRVESLVQHDAFYTVHMGRGYERNSIHTGTARSVNSEYAICEFEVPMGLITKATLSSFFASSQGKEALDGNEFASALLSLSVSEWRAAAKRMGQTSRHHTGLSFARTPHYSLQNLCGWIGEELEEARRPEAIKIGWQFSSTVASILKESCTAEELVSFARHIFA